MADLVEWLTAQLDAVEREADRDEPGCSCRDLGCHHTESRDLLSLAVAAHRAILDAYTESVEREAHWRSKGVEKFIDWSRRDQLALHYAVRAVAGIYRSRPGYDPAWAVET